MEIHGKMTVLLIFSKFCHKRILFIAVIFQFHKYFKFVFIAAHKGDRDCWVRA